MKREELIEKYVQNNLSSKEKIRFDELFKSDIDFKEEAIFQINLKKAIIIEDESNFRNLISDLEYKANKPKQKRSYIKWLAAASILLLLSLPFLNRFNKTSYNELFAQNFEPYRNVIQPIERNSNVQDEKELAFTAYEKGDYDTAITLFSNLYNSTKEPYYLFYKANALLKLDKADEAVPLLLEHLRSNDTLTEKTYWYLALSYLKLNDEENVKKNLKIIIENKKYKSKEALKLLNKLE